MLDKDVNITYNLELLDFILKYLIDSETYSNNVNFAHSEIFKNNLEELKYLNLDNKTFEDLYDNIFSKEIRNDKNRIKLNEAFLYLELEGLIRVIEQKHIRITYQGIIQYSKGYLSTYNSEQYNQNRLDAFDKFQRVFSNRMTWINGAIALGTLVAMIYYILEMISTPYCFCK
jgi:hypothetical protein